MTPDFIPRNRYVVAQDFRNPLRVAFLVVDMSPQGLLTSVLQRELGAVHLDFFRSHAHTSPAARSANNASQCRPTQSAISGLEPLKKLNPCSTPIPEEVMVRND
jgi:hypothetical protein